MDVSEDSSSNVGTYDYDVFLSFNGFGFRHVADELCRSLKVVGIRVFKGEELGGGEDIASSLCKAIKRSRISIPIFSSDYARNAQCLDEVVQMLECRESQGHRIFPIYSFVDPDVVRNQMGPFRNRLTEHEIRGIDLDRIEIWKKALRQVACLKGWEVRSLRDYDPTHIVSYVLQSLTEDNSSSVTMGVSEGSSDLVDRIPDYDVFLNFGPDVIRDFADLLYRRLKDAGVIVFRGEDIAVGEEMVDFTQQVIKRARISIPVFSGDYAKSRRCLDEVSGMVECRKSQGHRVFPIYYQIDPDKIRYQLTDSGDTHQGEDPDRMEMWKRALREVTSLKGWKFDQWSDYDKCIERIISHVLQSLREDITSITMDVPVGSSLVKGTYDYDVFLSFGSDIERDFADPFYHRLKNASILIYRGEDIPVGEEIAGFALQAMKRSKISIPIFSKEYARSQQCLDDVVGMLECRKSQGHKVFPVYYRIDPYDIRNQMGGFGYYFSIHDKEVDHGRIEIWEQALREVASLKGWERDRKFQDGDIERIISHVLQSLKELHSSSTVDVSKGSSDLVDRIPAYDVFLNFGPDVIRDFADLLYRRLKDAGVIVFRGEDIAVGEEMVDFTQQVIKRARISIPVFSGDYAESRRCLDEVSGMVECRKSQGHRVFPIYDQIDPDKIRYQLTVSGDTHQGVDPDRMEMWKRALREVTSLKGWKFDQWSDYDKCIERIISHVLQSLREDITSITMDVPVGSSLVKGTYDYDVFLSFGSDIERDFADPFYHRLKNASILIYKGEDIPVGEEIAGFALQAMKRSKISIPIFSKEYARSQQCLEDVVGMLECRKSQGHKVFPVYYRIDPYDIRNQMGEFGHYFSIHDKEVDHGRIEIWEQALREVASLKGWERDRKFQHGDIERIISHVLQSLKELHSSSTVDVSKGSSDLVDRIPAYDVFLNFGPDVKRDFADLLYRRLKDTGVIVFRGEDIAVGEEMVDFTQQVIKGPRISIPVFSRDYAKSRRCLDEVSGMVECRKSQGHRVFPIYYQIDSDKIRYQLTDSRYTHQGVDPDRMEMWKRALRKVTSLKGWKFDQWFRDEDNIEHIVSHVLQSLKEDDSSSITMDVSEGSSNLVDRIPDYDVFLNFGSDTRRGFADVLYHRLKDAGVLVFRDEDVPVGEDTVDFPLQAIKRSRISIPVFSKDYAWSQQCSYEVVQMLKCRKSHGHCVFPIYYQIDPRELKYRVEDILGWFDRIGRSGVDYDMIQTREKALDEVASLEPWQLDDEAEYVENRSWKKALDDVVSSECWELDDESMDVDTVKSVISKVRRTLNRDKLLQLDGGNVGTSATPFEVVLSFSAHDGIAPSLYKHMKDAGIRVLGFDELPGEEEIDKEFVRAIKNSEICIPFVTKDYLASTQCLRQLAHIMEARRNFPEKLVIPIFYGVEPPDVKLETDSYINLLTEHEQNVPTEVVQQWKEALTEVAELQGLKFKARGFRRNIKFIVISILNKLKEKHRNVLIGIQDQLGKLKKVLDVESQDVRFVGIYGIGGVGKTTLAKAIFDQLSTHFEGCSFLKDIRETTKYKGLRYLQDQLFRDITCADNDCETKTTRHIFLEKKVIIVLDDVNERGQIKKLVGKANQFVSGSRIIVTTRDINVLAVEHETLDGRILEFSKEVRSFKMGEMEPTEALQLFCCHAFGKVYPPLDYVRICDEVVSAIGKLPLALEIMGSFLNHKPKSLWKETLEKLKKLPDHELHTKLMISYEALDLETKEVFLDIACFFTGQDKTTPIYMWEACKLLPQLGIEALTFLSFVKILGDNRLWMHNEVRDFGRKFTCGGFTEDFGRKFTCGGFTEDFAKCSRLWVNEDVMDILRRKKVNKNVQGLKLMFDEFLQDSTSPPLKLRSLPNLRFLEFSRFPFAMKRALPKLRWLSWHFCPQHVKASNLYLKNLVILDLSNSNVSDQLGESGQLEMAKNLKVLNLTNCKRITRTPIFSDCMILERLILEGCENLIKIDSSIGNLKQLMYLNLSGCYSLEELPNELGSATTLTELIIKGNGQPFKLQESLVGLTSLLVLEIDNLEIVDPVMHIGNSKKLERLILSKCSGLKKLSKSGKFFALSVKLDLSGSEIICLPDSIGEMKNLKVINVESSLICELPVSIGNLEKLEELHAKKCRSLKGEIPNEIGALSSLGILDLSFTRISSLPTTLSNLSNLQTLNLEFCDELEKLPELPTSLVSLHVMSKKLRTLPDLSKMNSLIDLKLFCPIDKFQADWIGKLSRLEKLELWIPRITVIELGDTSRLRSLSVSCKEIGSLAQLPLTLSRLCLAHLNKNTKLPSLCNLKSLTFIEFYNCSIGDDEFKSIETDKLESLEHLSACKCNFSWNYGLPLPERLRVLSLKECKLPSLLGLQTLKNLMHLELIDCQELTEIRGLDKLESLEEIIIYNCNSLEKLGDLSDLKKLKALQIHSCERLREVVGLERMNILKQLEICCCELLESSLDRLKLKRSRKSIAGSAPKR